VASLLARKNGWWTSNSEHPTAACWSRWKGVKDMDGIELADRYPDWASALYCVRGTATNHIIGDGWWSWWIPLKGGDMSGGIVFDQRLVELPQDGGKAGDRLKKFLMKHPVARELLEDATYEETDAHWRKNLAYYSSRFAGGRICAGGRCGSLHGPLLQSWHGLDLLHHQQRSQSHHPAAQRGGHDKGA